MYSQDDVELALYALEEGMKPGQAAELVGCSREAVCRWAAGLVPHAPSSGTMRGASGRPRRRERPVTDEERKAFEAAMTENMLLRAVLDDLKEAGSIPASISNRKKTELGERLRLATDVPLREIIRFLGISKSSYEYHRSRLGRDAYARLRREVAEIFTSLGGGRGYRPVWAELRRRGTRVSEKVVRRIMCELGLCAARRKGRAFCSYAGEATPAPANLPLREDGTHDFSADKPNVLWVTDITEFRLPSGDKAYLKPHNRLLRRTPCCLGHRR